MIHRLVHELAEDADLRVDETVACRVLRVSRSGYYGWLGRAPSVRQVADEQLSTTITEIHAAPRGQAAHTRPRSRFAGTGGMRSCS